MNTLRKHKHAVLLVALVGVGIMESLAIGGCWGRSFPT
jgi:hypothetical protein